MHNLFESTTLASNKGAKLSHLNCTFMQHTVPLHFHFVNYTANLRLICQIKYLANSKSYVQNTFAPLLKNIHPKDVQTHDNAVTPAMMHVMLRVYVFVSPSHPSRFDASRNKHINACRAYNGYRRCTLTTLRCVGEEPRRDRVRHRHLVGNWVF